MPADPHHIVVVGAGFGGLTFVQKMRHPDARITLIDRENHHLFQPLLYQTATTVLSVDDIAWPVRSLLKRRKDVTVLQAELTGIDRASKSLSLGSGETLHYDTLVVATGSVTSYFGHDGWERHAPGLKTVDDAVRVRARILSALEEAERTGDIARRRALQTFVVIGGGPTGVEIAGMIVHLCQRVLPGEFRRIDPTACRILMIEGGPRLLAPFAETLSDYTRTQLEKRGVEVMTGTMVKDVTGTDVVWGDGPDARIDCATTIWAAGVAATPVADWLDVKPAKGGRVAVGDHLTLPGDEDVFVIGDAATVPWKDGQSVPGLAPAAKQMGSHVAKVVRRRLTGRSAPKPFGYADLGSLATIGQGAAVIEYGRLRLRGLLAWWAWGIAHIYFLITQRNRAIVLLNWFWFSIFGRNGARVIFSDPLRPGKAADKNGPQGGTTVRHSQNAAPHDLGRRTPQHAQNGD